MRVSMRNEVSYINYITIRAIAIGAEYIGRLPKYYR